MVAFEFDDDVRARLRATVRDWNHLSINVLELLGIVVTAWSFVSKSDAWPSYARDTISMRGDDMSAVQWVSKCRRGREPRPGAVSYTHLRAHETREDLVCRLLLEKKK